MPHVLASLCAVALLAVAGCGRSNEPAPVATTEDEFAAYEAMIEADQQQTAEDLADATEQ